MKRFFQPVHKPDTVPLACATNANSTIEDRIVSDLEAPDSKRVRAGSAEPCTFLSWNLNGAFGDHGERMDDGRS